MKARVSGKVVLAIAIVGVALSVLAVTATEAVGFDAKTKPKPVALSNEQIAAALLALDDFPAGWAYSRSRRLGGPVMGAERAASASALCAA